MLVMMDGKLWWMTAWGFRPVYAVIATRLV